MQLFISNEFEIDSNKQIKIYEDRIIYQLKNVLRVKNWTIFYIQEKKYFNWDTNCSNIRYKIEIIELQKNYILWKIVESNEKQIFNKSKLIIPVLNKLSKIELIIQKLCEIWIWEILIYEFKRSLKINFSNNKIERLNLICIEAVEQSFWYFLPKITFLKNFEILEKYKNKFNVFHIEHWNNSSNKNNFEIWIVWPEWWFCENEIEVFKKYWCEFIWLWKTILKSETSCIIWWRNIVVNL